MTEAVASLALLAPPEKALPPSTQVLVDVSRAHGVSPITQLLDMMRLRHAKNGVYFEEYYSNRIYLPQHTKAQKKQFIGRKGNFNLNKRLSPFELTKTARGLLRDKIRFNATIAEHGFRTTHTQAVVMQEGDAGGIPALRTVAEIEAFLLTKAEYPIFVKPQEGTRSVGSALIEGIDPTTRELKLFNGKRIVAGDFAREVLSEYASGFLIQSALRQHPDLSKVAGPAVGTIRVVTVMRNDTPEVLYTLWKIPSPNAMSDNFWQDGSMLAEIDKDTGKLVQCRRGSGLTQEMMETHPTSGHPFASVQIPHWDEVLDMTTRCHKLWPNFGVLGWDIAITEEGPSIIECNCNPFQLMFQLATGKGIYNETFAPIFDAVEARGKALIAKYTQENEEAKKAKH